jgi:hypothetical protein
MSTNNPTATPPIRIQRPTSELAAHSNPELSPSGNSFNIEFDAGRNDTSPVADSFNGLCGGWKNEWCTTYGFTRSPGELNFYFELDLMLEHDGVQQTTTVYLAQGSVG